MNYWGEQPKISKITFKVIPDGQARVMALQSGEVDLIGGRFIGQNTNGRFAGIKKNLGIALKN